MKYYVTADVHGYFRELKAALTQAGYFEDTQPRKLIVCGDLFDRGGEAAALQRFILELMERDEVILIRGNHEDLALDLLNGWHRGSWLQHHHHSNGTVDTLCQLTGFTLRMLHAAPEEAARAFLKTPYIQRIIPAMMDYFETERYIFTHGWLPCIPLGEEQYAPIPDWRRAEDALWRKARWINGMEAHHSGITEPGKTVVCGHWHCSFGHSKYEGDGGEFDRGANFSPYQAGGILALDACTARSGKVNCVVLED